MAYPKTETAGMTQEERRAALVEKRKASMAQPMQDSTATTQSLSKEEAFSPVQPAKKDAPAKRNEQAADIVPTEAEQPAVSTGNDNTETTSRAEKQPTRIARGKNNKKTVSEINADETECGKVQACIRLTQKTDTILRFCTAARSTQNNKCSMSEIMEEALWEYFENHYPEIIAMVDALGKKNS